MDLCGTMQVESINEKKHILVIVDDYSRFTWVKFLLSNDETPEFVIKFLKKVQVALNTTIRNIRIDNGTKFVNQTLRSYYEDVGITHQTLVARTLQQNGIIERRNQTLVEDARTMLIFSKAPLFLWAKTVATMYLKYLHVFGALCYPTNDSEDLGKLKPKAGISIFIGYTLAKKAYWVYNKWKRMIMETIHVEFDEMIAMDSEQYGLGPEHNLLTFEYISSGLIQNPSSSTLYVPPSKKEWDILFQPFLTNTSSLYQVLYLMCLLLLL
ncbi:retrovirus-related pol polyprotein from transposon TNT 1-94 [Tanacetum coccineum]